MADRFSGRGAREARVTFCSIPSMGSTALLAERARYGLCSSVSMAVFSSEEHWAGNLPASSGNCRRARRLRCSIAMSSPYVLRNAPKVTAVPTTLEPGSPSELSAVKALFGEIAMGIAAGVDPGAGAGGGWDYSGPGSGAISRSGDRLAAGKPAPRGRIGLMIEITWLGHGTYQIPAHHRRSDSGGSMD